MNHRERAIIALERGIPDYVPTMELQFQLSEELLGREFLKQDDLKGLSPKEKDIALNKNAELHVEVYERLGHSIIPLHWLHSEEMYKTADLINKLTNYSYLLIKHGDGTFAIPDGNQMYEFSYRMVDDEEGLLEEAERKATAAIESNKRAFAAGIEGFMLCDDYCYNTGPFMSPEHFRIFITPYLTRIIESIRKDGGYAIKHTDGNIMPILDQLVEANPHAIHSLDPMAGVDIAEVKRLVGDQVCLIGNVNCALLQTGTMDEIKESALYCLKHGKPGGGYIYSTSNVPFKGLPLDRYLYILDIWKEKRDY